LLDYDENAFIIGGA